MVKTHCLKTWTPLYNDIVNPDPLKRKTLEIRKDDRNFEVGDVLILQDFDAQEDMFTGRECWRLVTHCLREKPWVPDGYVAMSVCEISPQPTNHV